MVGRTNTGGASLNLRIMGGNTQPTSPVENMVWLNTNVAIPHWYIQNDAPADPVEGTVYITVMTSSNIVLQTLRNNGMKLYFGTAYQYQNGSWATLGGQVYQNGAWKDLQKFVYNAGVFNENYATGMNVSSSILSGNVTNDAANGYLVCSTSRSAVSQHAYGYFYFNQKVNLTDVKTIKFTFSASNQYNDGGGVQTRGYRFVATSGNGANQWDSPTRGTPKRYDNPSASSPASVELDVSTLTGENYVGAAQYSYNGSTTIRIHNVELIS